MDRALADAAGGMGGEVQPGLAHLLSGEASFAEAIYRDQTSRLHIVQAGGEVPSNFGDMALIFDALRATYDFVILATGADAAARLLAAESDLTLLFAEDGRDRDFLLDDFEAAGVHWNSCWRGWIVRGNWSKLRRKSRRPSAPLLYLPSPTRFNPLPTPGGRHERIRGHPSHHPRRRPAGDGRYAGKVLLIVNVASKCGFTPQYAGLEALQRRFAERGFDVLGFPCDQFGHQEPGNADEIKNFCSLTYDVTFPMFAKVEVNGEGAHPLYRLLKKQAPGLLGTEAIKWNFTKFLVGRDGKVVKRYAPTDKPEALAGDVEMALAKPT